MTRAEYEAKYGARTSTSTPVKMTRAEYEAKYGKPAPTPEQGLGSRINGAIEKPAFDMGQNKSGWLGTLGKGVANFAKDVGANVYGMAKMPVVAAKNLVYDIPKEAIGLVKDAGGVGKATKAAIKEIPNLPKYAGQAVLPPALQELAGLNNNFNPQPTKALESLAEKPVSNILPYVGPFAKNKTLSKTPKELLPDIVTKDPVTLRTEKISSGLQQMNENLKSANTAFGENTKTYKNPDGTKTTVTPIDTFARYGIEPEVKGGKLQMGDYKSGEGPLGKIKTQVESLDAQIDTALKNTGKKLPIEQLKKQAIADAKANTYLKQAGKVQTTIKQIEARFADYEASYGLELDIAEINNIRKVANKDWSPETQDVSRIVGDTTREIVYNATEDRIVKQMLRQQGELLAAKKYAESLNNRAVKGGRLGNYAARTTGAIIGATLPVPVLGPLLGVAGGDLLAKGLQKMQFKSLPAAVKGALGGGQRETSKAKAQK